MNLNLRRHLVPKNKDLDTKLLNKNPKRLTKDVIAYLEWSVPLIRENFFNSITFNGTTTRTNLLRLVKENKISLRIAQLEIRRRGKIRRA